MNRPRSSRPAVLAGALAQGAAGLGAHVAVAGCLPSGRALGLAVPASLLAALLVGRVLTCPLTRLAVGQLAVHAMLAVSAACTGGHALSVHAAAGSAGSAGLVHGEPHLLMTLAHVGALVLCRATLDRVEGAGTAAADQLAALRAWLPRRPVPAAALLLPELPASGCPKPVVLRSCDLVRGVQQRGPPAGARAVAPAGALVPA